MKEEKEEVDFDEIMEALPWKDRNKILSKLRGEGLLGEGEELDIPDVPLTYYPPLPLPLPPERYERPPAR